MVEIILEKGIESIRYEFDVIPGIPLKPMLAHPSKNVCENKYDGERIQIHCFNGNVVMYSRNLENSTNKFNDIIVKCKNESNVNYILDAEVVAYDRNEKKILSFQILSTRRRKDPNDKTVDVCVFVFDILYFKNKSLIDLSLEERRKFLYENFEEIEGRFLFAEKIDCTSIEEIEEFFGKANSQNYEGIMIKTLERGSNYMPSQRSNSWIKLKKDYLDNVSDSFDLVVIGAYYGKGKRTGWYGGFLLASYNEEECLYETVCKIGTGFDESILNKFTEEFNAFVIEFPKEIRFKEQTKPDVWIQPRFVWEIRAAGISLSPIYCCGMGDDYKGMSLRFPRFIREREDKNAVDATKSSQVYNMYKEVNEEDIDEDF